MLDINYIRENIEKVKQNILNRGFDPSKANIDRLMELDLNKGKLQIQIDDLRAKRNELSKAMGNSKPDENVIMMGRDIKTKLSELESDQKNIVDEWMQIMAYIPNMALENVPIGKDPSGNVEIKAWNKDGYIPSDKLNGPDGSRSEMPTTGSNNNIKPIPHWEVGKKLDIIDLEAGARVSGSRFYYLKKDGVLLMYALFDALMKKLLKEGFVPMYVPILVREKALFGSSHFPADAEQVYEISSDLIEDQNKLYLIGSSEPSLFAYHMDSVIDKNKLPIKMMAQTSCFRSEAGSWGKDVRGIKRMHQFEKMEMDMIIEGDIQKSIEVHEYLLGINEWLLQELEIPYHVINMCTADLGYAAAAKKYDIEVWLPSEGSFMEVMSDSITTDFQSRRLNIKYTDGDKRSYVHTVNNTGATHRLLIAIIEHYQQEDGSIKVPKMLQELMSKEYIGK